MCPVRPSKGIGRGGLQFFLYCIEISFGQDTVRIQYDEIFAVATFGTVITGLSGTGVRFVVVMYIQLSLVLVHYLFARDR